MPNRDLSRGRQRELAARAQSELRSLTTAIDALDDRAARQFGINRTDMRCLDILTSLGAQKASVIRTEVSGTARIG